MLSLTADDKDRELFVRKFGSHAGLCTALSRTDEMNAKVIMFILERHLVGCGIEMASRLADDWTLITHMPYDFANWRYRQC